MAAMAPNMRAARLASTVIVAAALAGCSMAPPYKPPAIPTSATFKEAAPWVTATPADAAPRDAWWSVFGDAVLDGLASRIEAANPSLAEAVARYDQARAYATQARAARAPEATLATSIERSDLSRRRPLADGRDTPAYSDTVAGASLAYEVDLWGRVRNAVRAGEASAQASAADAASTRLALQAELVDTYVELRSLDAEARLLDDTVRAFGRALQLTEARHGGGAASGLDVGRARTQLHSARSELFDVRARRALLEHAIASLVGEVASNFSIAPAAFQLKLPQVPATAPSDLLQRRPDVGAAERRMAAANAQIGVERAALFPSISLGASAGFEAAHGNLLSATSGFWALGPLSAALAIFDGRKRRAAVTAARGRFDEAAAAYRGTVLMAFREVEDNLALTHHLALAATDQRAAVSAAEKTRDLALIRYREGATSYLEVVTAQTAALVAEREKLSLHRRQFQATVGLIRALGGGWEAAARMPHG